MAVLFVLCLFFHCAVRSETRVFPIRPGLNASSLTIIWDCLDAEQAKLKSREVYKNVSDDGSDFAFRVLYTVPRFAVWRVHAAQIGGTGSNYLGYVDFGLYTNSSRIGSKLKSNDFQVYDVKYNEASKLFLIMAGLPEKIFCAAREVTGSEMGVLTNRNYGVFTYTSVWGSVTNAIFESGLTSNVVAHLLFSSGRSDTITWSGNDGWKTFTEADAVKSQFFIQPGNTNDGILVSCDHVSLEDKLDKIESRMTDAQFSGDGRSFPPTPWKFGFACLDNNATNNLGFIEYTNNSHTLLRVLNAAKIGPQRVLVVMNQSRLVFSCGVYHANGGKLELLDGLRRNRLDRMMPVDQEIIKAYVDVQSETNAMAYLVAPNGNTNQASWNLRDGWRDLRESSGAPRLPARPGSQAAPEIRGLRPCPVHE